MRSLLPLFAAAISFAASASQAETSADVEDLLRWMTGHFSSAAQVASDPEARLRHVYGTRVDLPNVPGETMYLEWHAGGPDGPVDSQRIWAYEAKGDHITMRFYTFYEKADTALTGIRGVDDIDRPAVAALTLEDFHDYPEECTFILNRSGTVIEGKNGIGHCRIFNRSLDVWMRPDVMVRFEPGRIYEAGTYTYEAEDSATPPDPLTVVQDFRRID